MDIYFVPKLKKKKVSIANKMKKLDHARGQYKNKNLDAKISMIFFHYLVQLVIH